VPGFGESFTHRFTQPSWQRIDQTRSFVHEEPESNWIFQTPTKSNEALQGPRCFASTGFGSHGATHALLAGESIAEHLAGAPRSLPRSMRQRFRPDRFDPRRPMKN
jgi:glycine/D-amino acid oxidase-like deaminating enzyme